MQNIVIATDFSKNAYAALAYATQLQRGTPCKFYILNVYNAFTPLKVNDSARPSIEQLAIESKEGLQHVFHRIQLENPYPGHLFEVISRQGELGTVVSELVEKLALDLIVIGNKGRSELEAIFFGSNALTIIGKIKKCPILTVPKELDFKPLKNMAFVTDYGRPYDAGLLHPLVTMAARHGAKIRVMHINDTKELSRAQDINLGILMEYLKPFEATSHWMPFYKSKATAINNFLKELNIDILIMVNYQHSLIQELTHEPVIKRMAFNPEIPFFVIAERD